MLDEDEAGRAARAEIVQRLAVGRYVKIVPLCADYFQPDALSYEALTQLVGR